MLTFAGGFLLLSGCLHYQGTNSISNSISLLR